MTLPRRALECAYPAYFVHPAYIQHGSHIDLGGPIHTPHEAARATRQPHTTSTRFHIFTSLHTQPTIMGPTIHHPTKTPSTGNCKKVYLTSAVGLFGGLYPEHPESVSSDTILFFPVSVYVASDKYNVVVLPSSEIAYVCCVIAESQYWLVGVYITP